MQPKLENDANLYSIAVFKSMRCYILPYTTTINPAISSSDPKPLPRAAFLLAPDLTVPVAVALGGGIVSVAEGEMIAGGTGATSVEMVSIVDLIPPDIS